MPFALFFAGAPQGYTLVKRDIVANEGRLANHCAHAVVDEQTPSDLGARVNLDSRKHARNLRDKSRRKAYAVAPEPVAQVVCPHRVQSRIQEYDLEVGARRRVGFKDSRNILA